MLIPLPDLFRGLDLLPWTKRLVACLLLNAPLDLGEEVEFGVDSPAHYRALQAILADCLAPTNANGRPSELGENLRQRIRELNAAAGEGPKLNALVRKYAPAAAEQVQFRTYWDVVYDRSPVEER